MSDGGIVYAEWWGQNPLSFNLFSTLWSILDERVSNITTTFGTEDFYVYNESGCTYDMYTRFLH
jgi:hypothetical protein